MERKTDRVKDPITIIAEPGALTFATRKEWHDLPEFSLGELAHHETMIVFKGTSGVFFLLRDMNPLEFLNDTGRAFQLVKISIDEETGKHVFSVMDLCRAEAAQLMRNRVTLWD